VGLTAMPGPKALGLAARPCHESVITK